MTSRCVFSVEKEPNKHEPRTRFVCTFHYFSFRLVKLPWNSPLYSFLGRRPSFSKCWVMFGQPVCWLCALTSHSALLRPEVSQAGLLNVVTGLYPRLQNTTVQHQSCYCGATLKVDPARWSPTHAVAQPGSLRPQTRVNKHNQLRKHFGWDSGEQTHSPV